MTSIDAIIDYIKNGTTDGLKALPLLGTDSAGLAHLLCDLYGSDYARFALLWNRNRLAFWGGGDDAGTGYAISCPSHDDWQAGAVADALSRKRHVTMLTRGDVQTPDGVTTVRTPSAMASRIRATERAVIENGASTMLIVASPETFPDLLVCYRLGIVPVLMTECSYCHDLAYADDRRYRFVTTTIMSAMCSMVVTPTPTDAEWFWRFRLRDDVAAIPPMPTGTAVRLLGEEVGVFEGYDVGCVSGNDGNGIFDAIRAFEIVSESRPGTTLHVYGDALGSASEREVMEYVSGHGLDNAVMLHDACDIDAYHRLDVMLATGRDDRHMFECVCAGIPLVTFRVAGTPLADGRFGTEDGVHVVGRGDVEGMAGETVRLLDAERDLSMFGWQVSRRKAAAFADVIPQWESAIDEASMRDAMSLDRLPSDIEVMLGTLMVGWEYPSR